VSNERSRTVKLTPYRELFVELPEKQFERIKHLGSEPKPESRLRYEFSTYLIRRYLALTSSV